MFENIGGSEILLIMLAILILFGPKKIPQLAQGLGKGLREFKKASQDLQNQLTNAVGAEDFKNIANSVNSIKQDMTASVQKLGEQLQGAVAQTKNAQPSAQPALPAPTAGESPINSMAQEEHAEPTPASPMNSNHEQA